MQSSKHIYILFIFFFISFISNANKNVTLRINDAYGPFEYLNKDGKPIGFTVDVFNALNNINHFNYQVKSSKEIFNFYTTVIDSSELVTSMHSVPQDNKFIASQPYGYIDSDIITRIYSDINAWSDMDGKHVLIRKNSPLIYEFEKLKIKPKYIYIKSVPDGLRLLSSGKYDAMITSNDVAYFYISKLELTNLSVRQVFCQPLALRFVMLNTDNNKKIINKINSALQTIRSNGTYDAIYSKRFFPNADDSLKPFELSMIILSIAIMMILIIYILYIHWLYQSEKRKKSKPAIDDTPFITNLTKIYDSIPTVAVFFDDIGRIRFINKAGHDLVNASRKTRLYLGQHTLFNHTILNDEMIDKLKAKKIINFTYNLISKDSIFNHLGDYVLPTNKIYNIFIMPVSNYGTVLSGYLAYIYDITTLHNTEYRNLKYVTSLSQIADNNLLDICYYDSEDNLFYTFANNTAKSTDITYEKGLQYIHPLYRSRFIEEFLSILNGEKRTAKITIKKNTPKNQKYYTCDVTLNAIRVDSNTTIGISLVTTSSVAKHALSIKNNELDNKITFLLNTSNYQFFEYEQETDRFIITRQDYTYKRLNHEQLLEIIHPDDRKKANEIINDLKTGKIENTYTIIRYKPNSYNYNYYKISIHSYHDDIIGTTKFFGVYHNITEQIQEMREYEEFKEIAIQTCETIGLGYFEYSLTDSEHYYIPDIFTDKYGFDDENFMNCMDEESRNIFNSLIEKFNAKERNIGKNVIKLKSPITDSWIYFEFMLHPIEDDMNQQIYKYMGFLNDITDKYSYQ